MTKPSTKRISPFDIEAGKRLKEARRNAGQTQEYLADQVGLTFQQIQKYENGSNRMSIERVSQFSNITGTPILFFFGKESDRPVPKNSRAGRLIKKFHQLDDGLQEFVLDLTNRLLRKGRPR